MNPLSALGINNIPTKYLFPLPSRHSSPQERQYVLAAHINWVRELVSGTQIPSSFPLHETLKEDQIQAFLSQGKSTPLEKKWMLLLLTIVKCPKSVSTYKQLDIFSKPPQQQTRGRMNWPQIIDFIGEANFNFVWEQPQIRLLSDKTDNSQESTTSISDEPSTSINSRSPYSTSHVQMEKSLYFSKLAKCIYINLEESAQRERGYLEVERFPVSNLSQALSIIDGFSVKDKDCFLIFHPYLPYSLQDTVTFSQHKLFSTSRQMFVTYQILQFLRDFQTIELPLGDLLLSDFRVDECLYLSVTPSILDIIDKLQVSVQDTQETKGEPKVLAIVRCIVKKVKGWDQYENQSEEESICVLDPQLVESIIRHWCEGLISNYDYLMVLNYLCGRFCNGNPNFHPVFPWVTDFSSPQAGWRDLTKSKFRLNKGERQLDIMYEEVVPPAHNEKAAAHHVTDILSEITFYVYKARKTPKDVLTRFVRPKWVPAEYPASIMRMQEWTPDECIPELFDDPTMFRSIHDDLNDLQVPKWCSTPEEFIKYHRKLLESDYVSAKLHHWIDLTFGYKLSGQAAVKSKNIYLSLVDSHQNLESHGIVQLFQTAHPPKKNCLRNMRNTVHYKDLKKLREQEVDESNQETSANDSKTKIWKNINLPKHYDPMGFLNDFEVTMNFFKQHFPYLKNPNVSLTGLKDRIEMPHAVKQFGCLLLEIVIPQKVRHVASVRSVEERYKFYKDIVKGAINLVPLFCRRAVQAIFDRDCLEFSIPVGISLDLLLLGDNLGPIPFPAYFDEVYKMLRTTRNYEKILATAAPDDIGLKVKVQELKVKSFSRDLIQLLSSLDNDGIDLVLPFVIEMFENTDTRVLAVWNIFCPFARAIGRKKAADHLLYPIIQIYEADYHSDKHLKLFHRTFLLQLCSCFGLKTFLDHFSTLLIEAIGGWKLANDQNEQSHRTHLNSTDLEIEHVEQASSKTRPVSSLAHQQTFKRAESDTGDGASTSHSVEPEMFVMEPDASDSEGNDNNGVPVHVLPNENAAISVEESAQSAFPSVFVNEIRAGSSESSRHQSPHTSQKRYSKDGTNIRSSSVSSVGSRSIMDISELCCESVLWLSHRLGPVLSAKYLTKNLLRMLTLCYMEHLDLLETFKGGIICEGDIHSKKVLECLIAVSDLYGDSFIERQYIPYCIDIITSAQQRLTLTVEAALIGVSTLLEKIFHFIPDTLLMAQLKETVMKKALTPLIELICSDDTQFPSSSTPRALLASKCLAMMNSIRKKIGPDLTQLHLKPVILTVCKRFYTIYNGDPDIKAEMSNAFDSTLASQIFTNFCDVITGSEHESLIRDLYLQQGLAEQSLASKDDGSPTSEKAQQKRRVEQQSSFGSRSFGNRIQVQEADNVAEEQESPVVTKKDPTRHLRGNWLVYWEHEVGRSDCKFNFKQIKLQTFTGHTGSVRYIYALDNENSFLTASKDRTVKLFSLRNQGDENVVSNCQWTYANHKKAVLSVLFHEPLHIAASTDGFIHIWDPFVGKNIRVLEKGNAKNSPICALRPILNTSYFVGAGIDSTVHIVDCRTCSAYELKIGIGQASGLVRCMAVSDSGQTVSVGHSSGMLSTLDLRNGTLLGSWKAHEGEVLQLVAHRNKHLISSSFDQNISVWNLDENKLSFNMRGPTEPVHSLSTFESELISCTTSNRIGIHCGIDSNSDFSSTRLRSDTFKGIVTSMRLLPLNQFLLLGSDSGNVVLLC